jgi:hypothetical protein
MDKEPKTRQEKKGNKYKEMYNQKTIRLKEALAEKQKNKPIKNKK